MKVLLVDDDQGTRVTLRYALSQGGLEVHTAASSTEALRLLSEIPFDWLLTDGDLAPEDGFKLAEKAAQLQRGIKIVMISGSDTQEDAAGSPILRVFAKPVDPAALLSFLETAPTQKKS